MDAMYRTKAVLRQLGGWLTCQEVAKAASMHPVEIAPCLQELAEKGKIEHRYLTGHGVKIPVFRLPFHLWMKTNVEDPFATHVSGKRRDDESHHHAECG